MSISAAEKERQKTDAERSEDIAYTINHAIACTATDIFESPFNAWWQKTFHTKSGPIPSCTHHDDHSGKSHVHPDGTVHHGSHDDHHDHPHDHKFRLTKKWLIGEFAGDILAVPLTIAFQRLTPGFMDVLNNGLEAVVRPFFLLGSHIAAERWASKNHVGKNSAACQAKAEEIYNHEVSHLSQAFMWTASSIAINLTIQKKLLGNKGSWNDLFSTKLAGASFSTGLVVAGRVLAPDAARAWDGWTTRNVFLPMSKATGSMFGISEKTIENNQAHTAPKNTMPVTWQSRMEEANARLANRTGSLAA